VGLETIPKGLSKISVLAKDAAATRFANYTATSIANYLHSPVLGKRPKLIHKGTEAAAAEAATTAAEAIAAADLEGVNTASKLGPHTQTDRGTCPGVGL
jgi:hypothetical protein